MDRIAAWTQHHFDVTFAGDDWRGSESRRQQEDDFATLGVKVVYFPYSKGFPARSCANVSTASSSQSDSLRRRSSGHPVDECRCRSHVLGLWDVFKSQRQKG
jgi:hypothetical protein